MSSLQSNSWYLVGLMDNRIDLSDFKASDPSRLRRRSKVTCFSSIGNFIETKEEQPEKAPRWIRRTVVGMVSEVNDVQPAKEASPISSRPSGNSMETSEEHLQNAHRWILRTVVGIVSEVNDSQIINVASPISSRPSGNSMETSEEHP